MKRKIDRSSLKCQQTSLPSPVGGLNAFDAIANMPMTDAVIMDNVFPSPTSCNLRNGYINWVTGLPGWVETLMKYNSTTANKLFAASVAGIYDATSKGAVGGAVVAGLSNARFQHVNFSTPGGNYLVACNGADHVQEYDGTTWTNPTITGATDTTFINVFVHKSRLWFIPVNSTKVYYLPTSSIAGAASFIDFGSIFLLGGYLMAQASWSVNSSGTNTVNDYAVFISSEGEILVYQGTDPSQASTWALVGLFRIGRPIGRRCVTKFGADVVIICADGLYPLSKVITDDRSNPQDAVTAKIVNLINSDVQSYAANFGWQPILYPSGDKLIVNVPVVTNATQYQYVMNTITGAWCRFTGWKAACFEILGNSLFFGGNTIVAQCDTGFSDNNAAIVGTIKQAFSYFGSPGREKRFTNVRLNVACDGTISAAIALNTNFNNVPPTNSPTFSGNAGAVWNNFAWNTTPWGGANQVHTDWITVAGIGFSAALYIKMSASQFGLQWYSSDFVYENGGIL